MMNKKRISVEARPAILSRVRRLWRSRSKGLAVCGTGRGSLASNGERRPSLP